ncbi:L-aspartate oxidase [Candidatus Sulfurimonas baltica]|uniref:FAD-dependent oxidoreductase n=1 Tax=Candidatus Sulfurimonas baltica TaxID=2740404 RepID=A0A7S7LZ04_9BACT|nr:FAD-dependent oxidoreductase [Candidatus Sulfurimonas baltica]QOY53164.1 FAD-dependent oxidoreductase [Candidatus Sulfurimonas baltica]
MMFDVIVVGGGIAGLMAAIEAKKSNNKVAVITKGNLFKSNSSLASGGINAVLDSNNSKEIKLHVDDTIKACFGLENKNAITYMCNRAPKIIEKLVKYGVEFDKNEDGSIAQRSFGGGSSKRTCYVGDKTGSAIMQVLIKKAKTLGVTFLVNNFVMNLTTLNNRVSGVVVLRKFDSSVMVYPSKSVILAGGGYAGLYRGFSTNAQDYSGDMQAIALRAGLNLKDMEFVQFHPTGMIKTNYLVSEAARGEGGYLVNNENERFVDELDTRSVVSLAISKQIESGKKVFVDLRHLTLEHIEAKLPSLYKTAFMQAGIDISKELLPVKPVAHYSMGGIESDMTKTKLKGLFVCGECAVTGVHGANRLGGNSLLDGAVFGELAGINALKFSKSKEYLPIDYNIVAKDQKMVDWIFDKESSKNFNSMRISMGKTMFDLAGIHRSEESLTKAFDYLKYLRRETATLHCIDKGRQNNVELSSILELKNGLEVSEAVVLSALKRQESRGAHNRDDFADENLKLRKSILINEPKKGYFKVWYEDNKFMLILQKIFTN